MTDLSTKPAGPAATAWVVLGLCSGAAMAVAALLLTEPGVDARMLFPFEDKLLHAIGFAGLTGPAVLALPRRYAPFWLAHMAALGAGSEVVQGVSNLGRDASIWDFGADCVGIAAAWVLARLVRRRFER